jgi:hypothetical protein
MAFQVVKREAQHIVVGDVLVISPRLASFHSKPELGGTAQRVTEVQSFGPDQAMAIAVGGLPATGISPGTQVDVLVWQD